MNEILTANQTLNPITIAEILVNLSMSLLMGIGIFFTYKKTFQGVIYQKSFNVSLVAIAMILTFIIMIIKGNVALSLGMVGALSIIRFRTPIKDPMDLVFIFWAISIGIANGIGFFHISIVTSILVAITLFVMLKLKENDKSYLLILQLSDPQSEQKIIEIIRDSSNRYSFKSKSINRGEIEIILEVNLKDNNADLINKISAEKGLTKATLITSNENLSV